MAISPILKALAATVSVAVTGLAATVAGLSTEGFLALIVTLNAFEIGLIVANTARVSRVSGRYDADHP